MKYGAQLPNTIYEAPYFVDQNWRNPVRDAYMQALKTHKPAIATVLDLERESQFDEVIAWAAEAAQHVGETVIIIPKVMGIVPRIPETISGKQVRLGYSVPTSFAGTELPLWEFGRRPVHLLGGSPSKQLEIASYLNVESADGNYSQLMATRYGQFYACNGMANAKDRYWPRMAEIQAVSNDLPYHAFRLSCINIQAAWAGCRAYIRYGIEADIPAIKRIANQYKNELGFVNSAALKTSMARHEVFIAEYMGEIIGFVNWHKRRDGWATIYEVAIHKAFIGRKVGRALMTAIPRPRQLKCITDNPANEFYEHIGMVNRDTVQGRNRLLNVWIAV